MMLPRRMSLLLVALVSTAGPLGCSQPRSIDGYFAARDERVVEFCWCFGSLIGYRSEDGQYGELERQQCIAGEQLEDHQRACMSSIYEQEDPFEPDQAFDCLSEAETAYARCIEPLSCSNRGGLDECIDAYNDAREDCPRMSTNDEETFAKCARI